MSETVATTDYDVVVIGGGPAGTAFATWVKRNRPETSVALLDKRAKPGYKIGESTISTTINPIVSLGGALPIMRRLFHEKLGLHFWWTGRDSDHIGPHINVSRLDETFQLERPIFETMLHRNAIRVGVDVMRATEAVLAESDLDGDVKEIACTGPEGPLRLRTRLVCDATGPSAVLVRHLGLYSKDFDSFDTNAYFAYFRRKGPESALGVPQWDTVGTRHLNFEQGWTWFIDILSWRNAPQDRLEAMIDHLLDLPAAETAGHPTRQELSERFDCPVEKIFSIGVVPRADTDTAGEGSADERFQHYLDRYPGLGKVMSNYELVEDPYEGHSTTLAFRNLVHHSTRYAGDGWLAVGDAAFFVNPLFSPGLAYGFTMTHVAAQAAVAGLERGDVSSAAFREYDELATHIFAALLAVNELLYRSARHPDMFERCFLFWIAHNLTSGFTRAHGEDGEPGPLRATGRVAPPTVGGILDPAFSEKVQEIVALQRDAETAGEEAAETARKVAAIVDPYLEELKRRNAFQRLQPWRVFQDYDADLRRRDPGLWTPFVSFWNCERCGTWHNGEEVTRCVVCGLERPASAVA